MANQATQISETKYANEVALAFQQKDFRLKASIRFVPGVRGDIFKFPVISKGSVGTKSTNSDVPYMNAAHAFKTATIVNRYAAELLDEEDARTLSPDLQRYYVGNTVAAINRYCDSSVIAAMDASNTSSGQSASAFTFARLLVAIKKLNDVDTDFEGRSIVLDPESVRLALAISNITSADFVSLQAVNSGQFANVLGLRWIMSNELTSSAGSPLTGVKTYVWGQNAVGLAAKTEPTTRIERVSHKDAVQIMTKVGIGSVTILPEGCVQLLAAD